MDNNNSALNSVSSSMPQTDNQMLTQAVAGSYVDSYTPPVQPAPTLSMPPAPALQVAQPQVAPPVFAAATPQVSFSPTPTMPSTPQSTPPTPPSMPSAPADMPKSMPVEAKVSQSLEDQNIFNLLGISDVSDDEKEQFLDELQKVIWEDFLEHDVELLVTEEELADFKKIMNKQGATEEDRQSEMIDFLEKLIPDLEKILLEKALELKEEMMRERINDLKQLYSESPDKLAKVDKAAQLVNDQQWRAAAEELNSMAS